MMRRHLLILARSEIPSRKVLDTLEEEKCSLDDLFHPQNSSFLSKLTAEKQKDLLTLYEEFDEEKVIALAKDFGTRAITFHDEEYPPSLKNIYNPPLVLFAKGQYLEHNLNVAIIGSRKADEYGRRMTQKISRGLAEEGICIVSGLANGIDEEAHQAAIDAGGKTIAVMGTGPDRIYPLTSAVLGERIVESGTLITELFPKDKPRRDHFLKRNRIISGISRCITVIQAGAKSGTMGTVEFALEQGKDVLAVPGRADDPLSEGTIMLIKNGAQVATSADDILFNLGIKAKDKKYRNTCLSIREQCVYNHLVQSTGMTYEELYEKSGLSSKELLAVLGGLLMEGIIKEKIGGSFAIRV